VVCFHCQQAAEKYRKALLEELGLTVPKIHDLERLRTLFLPHHASLRPLRRGMLFLRRFSVDMRYPGEWASKWQAEAAFRWAGACGRTRGRSSASARPGRGARSSDMGDQVVRRAVTKIRSDSAL